MLGSPNPGQSFGRGLSGPQATEVKMARTEVGRRRISPYLRLIHFRVPHFGSERSDSIRELHFLMFVGFFAFSNLRKVRGFRSSLGGPNYAWCRCVEKKSMFAFLSVWKTRRRYASSGRRRTTFCNKLAASARILFVRCIFGRFLFFCVFKPEEGTWISAVSWWTQLCNMPLCRKFFHI